MTCKEYLESKGVSLVRTSRGWKCHCPLPNHEDNNPSFHIYEDGERQNWWCFGCSGGGYATDIYGLIMAMEGCSFKESVKIVGEPPSTRIYKIAYQQDSKGYIGHISPGTRRDYAMGIVRSELSSGKIDFDTADYLYRIIWNGYECDGDGENGAKTDR